MVKMLRYGLALTLLLVFAAPVFAQNDYPVFQLVPGYGNLGNSKLLGSGRHSGFTLDTDYNLNSKLGVELFTGYYNAGTNATLYTNTFGGIFALRKSEHIVPFGVAGFGFGSVQVASSQGVFQGRSMATRYGAGVDVPFHDSLAIRVSATRMGFHFNKQWESGTTFAVGIALNLSQ